MIAEATSTTWPDAFVVVGVFAGFVCLVLGIVRS